MSNAHGTATAESAFVLPKLHGLREQIDAIRWSVLDVLVALDEIERAHRTAAKAQLRAVCNSINALGLDANKANSEAEEYRASGDAA
jgi:hypothetical protein